ncbi:MAG: 7-carboxy-7-deazaguanine synthase [Candidatus Marinamargulisbacteria bacterium]|jgi:7-carboxy-7-deazaguanine synthase
MENDKLAVSETFYSIQGEGPTMGVPAVFLRLKSCNLTCGGPKTVQTKALENGATWRCDTIEVWLEGAAQKIEWLIDSWEENGFLARLEAGAHLVITGGEPLLQDGPICEFLCQLDEKLSSFIYVEMETNGTLKPSAFLGDRINQFNVSPKLANSGMSEEVRILPDVMTYFSEHDFAVFKFVLTTASDFDEMQADFCVPFAIAQSQIFLMPGCSSRQELEEISPLIAELAMAHNLRFSSRLQLSIWDRAVGV